MDVFKLIDPIASLPQDLSGKTDGEKLTYLRAMFSLTAIDKAPDHLWYWHLVQWDTSALFSKATNSLVRLPHQAHGSEYFWNITSLWSPDNVSVYVSFWWTRQEQDVVGMEAFGVIRGSTVEVLKTFSMGMSLSHAMHILRTQEAQKVILDQWPSTPPWGEGITLH